MKLASALFLFFMLLTFGGCMGDMPKHELSNDIENIDVSLAGSGNKVMEYHWGSGKQTKVATQLSFGFDQPTTCLWQSAKVSTRSEPGIDSVLIIRSEQWDAWSVTSSQAGTHIEVASQEAPDLLAGALYTSEVESGYIDADRWIVAGFFGKELNYKYSSFAPGHGMAFSLFCDQAFVVEPVRQGDEVSLVNVHSLQGTLVDVFGTAQVIAESHFHREIASPESGFWMSYGDYFDDSIDEGVVELTTPDAFASWSWNSNTENHLEHMTSGPGSYDLILRRIAVSPGVGSWWSVIYGFSETIPADVAGLDSSAIVY